MACAETGDVAATAYAVAGAATAGTRAIADNVPMAAAFPRLIRIQLSQTLTDCTANLFYLMRATFTMPLQPKRFVRAVWEMSPPPER
ncbi:hypothetical protein GCM10023196_086690 [Actinoallomurus vinaceus]|uniref:Uncharacterized protein n=1 Tax=Actinoallomurus vinaceus TaxID=1080074 RepID=A0ABP8UQ33_9ACTN